MQAQSEVVHAHKGICFLMGGSRPENNAWLLRDGKMSVPKPAIDRGDIKIVTKQFAREWLASEALRITEDALTKNNNNIQAIVASNDSTAGGGNFALPPQFVGQIFGTGPDSQLEGGQRIAECKQTNTIHKPNL